MASAWHASTDGTIKIHGTGTAARIFTIHGIVIHGTGTPGIVRITMADGILWGGV